MQEFKTMLTFSFKTLAESLPIIIGVIITSITLYVYNICGYAYNCTIQNGSWSKAASSFG